MLRTSNSLLEESYFSMNFNINHKPMSIHVVDL
jgi:hypothetical protein